MSKSLDLSVILAARDKITGPLKKINASSTATAKALKKSQNEIKQIKASQKDLGSFNKMDKALKGNTESLAETQNRMKRLRLELKTTKSPTQALRKEFSKAQRQTQALTRKTQDQRKSLGRMRKGLKDAGIDTRNLSREEGRLSDRLADANKRIQAQKKYLARLGKADVGGSFRKMGSEITKFSRRTAMASGGAAAAIFGLANSTATLGDNVAKTGDKIGIGLGPLQELRYAAERSGVSTQKFDSSMERFVKRMGEATQGTGAAKKAYEELGLSAHNLSKMTPEDSLARVADRLSSVENQSQRVAIAAKLFGREGVAMVNMMKDGSAGMKEMREAARATGYAMTDDAARGSEKFKDSLLDVQMGIKGMKNVIGAELQPAITSLMKDLFGWMKANKDQVQSFAKEFGKKLKSAVPILKDIGRGAASMASTLGLVTNRLASMVGGFDNLGMVLAAVLAIKPILAIAGMAKALFVAGGAVYGLVASLGAVGAAIKVLKVVMISSGIGALVVGIGAAAYLIYKNWDGIASWFKGLWGQVKEAFSGGIGGIGKLILNWSPLGLFYKAFKGVLSWFGVDLPKTFTGLGGKILDGLVGGILGGLKKVKETITGAGQKAIGWFKDTLGIKSPSRVFKDAGMDTLEGYRRGLKAKEPDALKDVGQFGKRVRQVGAGVAIGAAAMPLAANVEYDSRPPITPNVQASAPAPAQGDTIIHFNITGNNPKEIADEVRRTMMAVQREKDIRARSALYDRD